MKYCIKCGSPLEEHSIFCVKCGTPVEEDGVFYEEEFYLPKKVLRRNKRQALDMEGSVQGKGRRGAKIALVVCLLILFSVSGIVLYRTDIFSKYISQGEQIQNNKGEDDAENSTKPVIKVEEDEAETAFTPLGDKTDVDEEISSEESENRERYTALLSDIKEEANNSFKNFQGEYSLVFKDLANTEELAIGSEKLEAASIVKIFIMIEVYDEISQGLIKPEDTITLKEYMKTEGSGVIAGYKPGTELTYEELVAFMMDKSDNTAANILIDKLGFNALNNRMKALGCTASEFNRRMMDDPAINSGIENYVSMKDLALVLEKLYKGECVSEEYDNKMLNIMKANEQRNKLAGKLPAQVIIANKAGEYGDVTNDAGIVFTEKGAYIICISAKGSNIESQTEVIADLSKKIYDLYISYKNQV